MKTNTEKTNYRKTLAREAITALQAFEKTYIQGFYTKALDRFNYLFPAERMGQMTTAQAIEKLSWVEVE